MSLHKPDPPSLSTLAFRDNLKVFLAGPDFGSAGKVMSQSNLSDDSMPTEADLSLPGGPLEHNPQQVYTLGLIDLRNGAGISAARSVAWRYFAGTTGDKIVMGSVSQRTPSGEWKLTSVSYGARVAAALHQSQDLDSLPDVQLANYELRFLRIPGLNIEAFWLFSLTGPSDLIAVFPAPPNQLIPQLNVERVMPIASFLDIVVPMAVERLKHPPDSGS